MNFKKGLLSLLFLFLSTYSDAMQHEHVHDTARCLAVMSTSEGYVDKQITGDGLTPSELIQKINTYTAENQNSPFVAAILITPAGQLELVSAIWVHNELVRMYEEALEGKHPDLISPGQLQELARSGQELTDHPERSAHIQEKVSTLLRSTNAEYLVIKMRWLLQYDKRYEISIFKHEYDQYHAYDLGSFFGWIEESPQRVMKFLEKKVNS